MDSSTSSPKLTAAFLQKRWVRTVGLIPMTVYSFLAGLAVYAVLSSTVFRPPNQVFPGTDLIGVMGYIFFLGIIGSSGVLAIITAYYMRGLFRVLYVAGALAIISSAAYLPMSMIFNAEVDFYPKIDDPQSLVGTWMDEYHRLELSPDSTYTLTYNYNSDDGGEEYRGTWRLERNRIHFSDLDPKSVNPWKVRTSDGYYFITWAIPDNPDAWSGHLGLMREKEWRDHDR